MRQTERHVPVGDTRLYVVERGEGFPVLVLHGGPGLDHTMFADYLDPLTDSYRLVLVDQRSQGRSDETPPETWTLSRMSADVSALAAALGVEHGYAVLGHSYGAMVALQHAVDHSGEPAGTIVSSGLPHQRWLDTIGERLAAFEPEELREQVTASWDEEPETRDREHLVSILARQMPWHFADPRDPRIAEYNDRTSGLVGSAGVLRHMAAHGYGGIDVEDALPSVEHPVLVLAGRHDRTCPVDAAEIVADGIPGAELAIFEHSGHMTFVEEQADYLQIVRDFLDRVRR
ncbi:MAG TPA: alpha/beta fold hydrolase [Frankiaceae bacterium]|jgi:proline iminopeptidase|nr:alpha/beta fold hydrolase [Frankiaceae bacterium]